MKLNRIFTFLVSVSLGLTILVSCDSHEDDEILIPEFENVYSGLANPKQVFENGMPKSINTMVIKTYNNGLVDQIVDRTTNVKFEYRPLYSSSSYDVDMIVSKEDERKRYSMELSGKGFVERANISSEGSLTEWKFEYASGGYLQSIKKNVDGTTIKFYQLEWDNGNIVGMKTNYMNTEDTTDYTVEYGNKPSANKGAIMLWNVVYAVDLEDMVYAYYAGILGKSSKSLPTCLSGKNPMYSSSLIIPKNFKWSIDRNGFPTEMRASTDWTELDEFTFKW